MYPDLLNKCKYVTIECDPRLKKFSQIHFQITKKFINFKEISQNERLRRNYDYVIYAGSLGKF